MTKQKNLVKVSEGFILIKLKKMTEEQLKIEGKETTPQEALQPEEGRRRLSSESVEGLIKEAEKKMSEAKELIKSAKEQKVQGQGERANLYEEAATRYGEAAELLKSVGKSQEAAEAILHKAYALEEAEKTETNPGKKAELWERIADARKERAELLKSVGKFQEAAKAIESKVYALGKAAKIATNPEKMAELRKLIADAHKERAELLEEAQKLQQAAWAMRFSADVLKEVAQAEKDPEKRAELYEEAATRYGEAEKLFRRVWKLEEAAWAIRFRADALKEAEKTVTNPKKKTELWKLIADAHRKRAEILESDGKLKLEKAANARLEEAYALKEAANATKDLEGKSELLRAAERAYDEVAKLYESAGKPDKVALVRVYKEEALKEVRKIQEELSSRTPTEDKT